MILLAQKNLGNLTVFSEDGDKFFLILNGEKQNAKPETNIRVEELPQPYYSAKIVFEDSSLAPMSKQMQIIDGDDKMMDVTYRIRRDKSGKLKLNMYAAIEATPDFVAPKGMYVRHYGEAPDVIHTTTTINSGGFDANVHVPGVSMTINVNDPGVTSSSTTTTTTSTSTSGSSHSSNSNQHNNDNKCRGWAMNQGDFAAAKKTVSEAKFEDTKLSTAKSITASNCLSADQVIALCKLFHFEESKLTFAKHAYQYCIEPKNYFKVNTVFSFDASKDELSKFISGE